MEIDRIDLSLALPYKDFGKGFYVTSMLDQAQRMSKRTARFRGGKPTITAYEVADDILGQSNLFIKVFDGVTIEWARFVINNRNRKFANPASSECNIDLKYDIVFGPVGNDDITFLLEQYTNGFISEERLRDGLEFKKASDQYSFHTQKAISNLRKVEVLHVG